MYPIIIIAPPRSGTSVVARLLQEEFGVVMSEGKIKKDWRNPKGFYEDPDLNKLVQTQVNTFMSTGCPSKYLIHDLTWTMGFREWAKSRANKYTKWGFKEPRAVPFLCSVIDLFENPTFIYCMRQDKQIIKSQVDKLGIPLKTAILGIKAYRNQIDKLLKGKQYWEIDLTVQKSEKYLISELKDILNYNNSRIKVVG